MISLDQIDSMLVFVKLSFSRMSQHKNMNASANVLFDKNNLPMILHDFCHHIPSCGLVVACYMVVRVSYIAHINKSLSCQTKHGDMHAHALFIVWKQSLKLRKVMNFMK